MENRENVKFSDSQKQKNRFTLEKFSLHYRNKATSSHPTLYFKEITAYKNGQII